MKNSEPFFRSGKWCKDKSNILNHQIFQELFRKLFSKSLFEPASVGTFATFVSRLRRTVFVIADAKVGIISKRANIFELFLSFFFKKLLFGPIYLLYIRPVVVISSRRTPRPHAMGPRHRPDGRRKKCVAGIKIIARMETKNSLLPYGRPQKSLRTKSYTARERQEKMRQKGHFTEKICFRQRSRCCLAREILTL